MKNLILRSAALFGLVVAGPALAADMPVKAPVYKAAPAVVSHDWTGFYIGGSVGARWADSIWTTDCLSDGCDPAFSSRLANGNPASFDSTAFRGSVYGGFNWQFAQWLAGIEGDFGLANNTKTLLGIPGTWSSKTAAQIASDSSSVKETWDAGVRARFGFLISPNWLVYGTGGVSWLHAELAASCSNVVWCLTSHSQTISKTRTGWTAGGGIEVQVLQNWLARGEYRYADYGHADFGFFPGVDFVGGNVHIKMHTALVGLAYQFGGPFGKGPVVTRY